MFFVLSKLFWLVAQPISLAVLLMARAWRCMPGDAAAGGYGCAVPD